MYSILLFFSFSFFFVLSSLTFTIAKCPVSNPGAGLVISRDAEKVNYIKFNWYLLIDPERDE